VVVLAVSIDGSSVRISDDKVRLFDDALTGDLIRPDDRRYDEARAVWNGMIDRYPTLIARCRGVSHVVLSVKFARDENIAVSVRGGGHNVAGTAVCDRGLVIDLSQMTAVEVNQLNSTVRAQAGALLGGLDSETQNHGLAVPAGTVSETGIAGLTLGGGMGWLSRKYGLTCDNLIGVEMVMADGTLLHVDDETNAQLMWGLRGGGGNFGIVTSFEYGLHPMQRQVIAGDILFPISLAREFLRFYGEFCTAAPDDLYCDAMLVSPEGSPAGLCGVHVCYSGPAAKADTVLAPIRKLGKPIVDTVAAIDYVELQRLWDDADPRNGGEYFKAGFVNEVPGSLADRIVDGFEVDERNGLTLYFQHSGGAIGRIAAEATAFPHRRCIASMFVALTWPEKVDPAEYIDYVRSYWKTLETSTDGYYTNDTGDEPQAMINANYQVNFERLLQLKNKYDPANLFRLNANIKPTV